MTRRSPALLAALFVLSFILPAAPAYAQGAVPSFVMVTWNIQSGQSDPNTIAEQMALFDGVDVWTLQEVNDTESGYYRAGAEDSEGTPFGTVLSSAGDGNHLLTLYDKSAFTLVKGVELTQINTTGNARPALVVQLRDIATGAEFLVMNNHLYSSHPEERLRQAALLATWAQQQTLPVIAGGDMNFEAKSSDPAYVAITAGGYWDRIAPDNDGPTRPNGRAIDHIFVSGDAQQWPVSAQIVERENDLDNEQNSDHRPVLALVGPEVAAPLIPCSTTTQACLLDVPAAATAPAKTPASAAVMGVTTSGLNVRSLPSTSGTVLRTLAAGASIIIASTSDDGLWYALDGGGWVSAAYVTKQDTTPEPATRGGGTVFMLSTAVPSLPTVVPPQYAAVPPQPTAVPSLPTAVPLQPTAVPVQPTLAPAPPTATPVPERAVTAGSLVIIKVDKGDEFVVIRNDGGAAVDLSGWVLLSEKGQQACSLGGTIEPGATLTISALGDIAGFNCGFGGNIWNNSDPDPAALIAPDGSVVSRFVE